MMLSDFNHAQETWLRQKNKNKSKVIIADDWWLTCHEQWQNSSGLGVPSDRNPDPHICIVQSQVTGLFPNL